MAECKGRTRQMPVLSQPPASAVVEGGHVQ